MANRLDNSDNNSSGESLQDSAVIVYGPKTRVARAFLNISKIWNENRIILVVRNESEAQQMRTAYPNSKIAYRDRVQDNLPMVQNAAILCCAAGPIHVPDSGFRSTEPDSFLDLKSIEACISFYRDSKLAIILISTVLALAPKPSRSAYAGWKLYLEGSITQALQKCHLSRLNILFPGRLIEEKTFTNPFSICYSSYSSIAARISSALSQVHSTRQLIGFDARIWLLINRCLALISYLAGRY